MNEDLQADLFEVLGPPRGGLAGLRARLEREGRRRERARRMRWAVAGAAVILALIAITPFSRPIRRNDSRSGDFHLARMRLGMECAPTEILTIPVAQRGRIAAQRIPLTTDRVILYRIGSLAGTDLFSVREDGGISARSAK